MLVLWLTMLPYQQVIQNALFGHNNGFLICLYNITERSGTLLFHSTPDPVVFSAEGIHEIISNTISPHFNPDMKFNL